MVERKRYRNHLLFSLLFTSLFLIGSSFFIYAPNREAISAALSSASFSPSVRLRPLSSDIVLERTYPVSTEEGLTFDGYLFEVVNQKKEAVSFSIRFQSGEGEEFLSVTTFAYSIVLEDGSFSEPRSVPEDGIILTDTLLASTQKRYRFQFWLPEEMEKLSSTHYFQGSLELLL